MTVGEICSRNVRAIRSGASIREAARMMSEHDVGSLVVVSGQGPVEGIVTDRDIVLRLVAEGGDPDATKASQLMSRRMASVPQATPVERALEVMAEQGVRRLVVTNAEGGVSGLLSLDDLLGLLTHEFDALHRLLNQQVGVR